LLKNLRERLKEVMDCKQSCLPEVERHTSDAIPAKAQGIKNLSEQQETDVPEESEKYYRAMSPYPRERPTGMCYDEFHKDARRDNRYARYEAVRTLYEQGFKKSEISRRLGLCRETITRFLEAGGFPERKPSPQKASILDAYKPYLLQRWQQRCWNGAQLYMEIKEKGYTGSQPLLTLFLADLRKKHHEAGSPTILTLNDAQTAVLLPSPLPPKPQITHHMSPTQASWLFFSQFEKLDEKQRKYVEQIRQSHCDLEIAYQLGQGFVMMLEERRGADLDTWLIQAEHSSLPEFKKMASGIRLDYLAVKAAFSSEWSQGQVEGAPFRRV
jgi:transposase